MDHALTLHSDGTLTITLPKDAEVSRVVVNGASYRQVMGKADCISRRAAIEHFCNKECGMNPSECEMYPCYQIESIQEVPSAEPERNKGEWTTEEVAEILFNVLGDDCACNFNSISEWLPERCKYTEIADECPNPKEKHGCWMQFLLQGGADMKDGEQE